MPACSRPAAAGAPARGACVQRLGLPATKCPAAPAPRRLIVYNAIYAQVQPWRMQHAGASTLCTLLVGSRCWPGNSASAHASHPPALLPPPPKPHPRLDDHAFCAARRGHGHKPGRHHRRPRHRVGCAAGGAAAAWGLGARPRRWPVQHAACSSLAHTIPLVPPLCLQCWTAFRSSSGWCW